MSDLPVTQADAQGFSGLEGLEDFDRTDIVMPTIRIEHTEGVFVDGLSNDKFTEMDVVLLGLVKQRVLWEPEVEEKSEGPLCRSFNFTIGHPDQDRFPWAESGFQAGAEALPCESCKLKDWGSHPKRDAPWCSSQYTFPLIRQTDSGAWVPAILTVQRSALKACNSYLSSFVGEKVPTFTVVTHIKLDSRKRGNVQYGVPEFSRGSKTEEGDFGYYQAQYRQIREFISTPRKPAEAAAEGIDTETPAPEAPVAAPAPAPGPTAATAAPKAPAPAPAASDDEELPF